MVVYLGIIIVAFLTAVLLKKLFVRSTGRQGSNQKAVRQDLQKRQFQRNKQKAVAGIAQSGSRHKSTARASANMLRVTGGNQVTVHKPWGW